MDKYGTGQDPYCYAGTDLLINRFGLRQQDLLDRAERELTVLALQQITFTPPPYNLAYLQDLHRLLFSELYDWAGKVRTIDISKQDTRFCRTDRIKPEADKLFQRLATEHYFEHLDTQEALVKQFAEFYADLNMIHPFREGNGRAQRLLFDHLALHCGYWVDWNVVGMQPWIEANIEGVYGRFTELENIFRKGLQAVKF